MYYLVINNKSIEIINQMEYFQQKVSKTNIQNKIIFICSNNIFTKIYSAIICRIYILLYNI